MTRPVRAELPPIHYVGLDLGQLSEPSALAVLEMQDDRFALRFLQRWPLGTRYPQMIEDVRKVLRQSPLDWPTLVLDGTAVGTAIVQLFRDAELGAQIKPVRITSGNAATFDAGSWHVPKRELVSALQAVLQTRRLRIARHVPHVETLQQELLHFRVRTTTVGTEASEPWRERDCDDLVLSVALAVWAASRDERGDVGEPLVLGRRPDPLGWPW